MFAYLPEIYTMELSAADHYQDFFTGFFMCMLTICLENIPARELKVLLLLLR